MSLEISVDAPIGYIWLLAFPNKLQKGMHPLPNTLLYPYQQNLKTTAQIHYNRDVIVHYLGDLSEDQVSDMESLTELNPNIKVVDFFSLDWEKYNFSFIYNDKTITLLEFLKMDNSDNLLGLRKDIAEHLLLLYNPKGIIFIDFDNKILQPILDPLPTDIGILCGWDTDMENRFNFFVNNSMVVAGPNNPVLEYAFDELQKYFTLYGIDSEQVNVPFVLTSQNLNFKNLNTFTGEWKLFFIMCDLQCCSIVNALSEKFQIDAFDKQLVEKIQPIIAFKYVLANSGNYLYIDSDGSRTWVVDNKYETIFNNMYRALQVPLKTEFRAMVNNSRDSNSKPLDAHVIISYKNKFNLVEQFLKLNPDRKTFLYTFEWIAVPKHFKHNVIILKNYICSPSTYRLAMTDILREKGGVCWTMQHNPVKLPPSIDERSVSCLQGCFGNLCGYCMCFDVVAVDRPMHKIMCETKHLTDIYYEKYGIQLTLNHYIYLDSHPSFVEYIFKNSQELFDKLVDILLWYSMSGYTPSVQKYIKNISFETMVEETRQSFTAV